MSCWKSIKGPLTVLLVVIVIIFICSTSQIFVLWPFFGLNSVHSKVILATLNFFVFMIFVNYYLTCATNPGIVPQRWLPRQQAYIEVKKSTHTPRFCKTCDNHKPPRAHHCSSCHRCVLKMDHHCPWVNNCVGFANYGHFFRLIIYVDISIVYLFVLLCYRLAYMIRDIHHAQQYPHLTEIVFLSINMLLVTIVMIGVGILTGYHLYCITSNTTTIEGWEKGRSLTIKGMGKIQNVKYPYHQGIFKNIQAVLGKCPLFWLVPQPMKGDGLNFPLNTKSMNECEALDEKDFSSRSALNRPTSVASQWTMTERFSLTESLNMKPLKAKASMNTIDGNPPSIMTFASNAPTLIDHRQSNVVAKRQSETSFV
ncbi:DHHC palmitoyltransferase-domain-containing protein [Choanephora cucurbitarum]|nr:DHHC palmitoyltransferase-domain-containing protein [Choanephora cucurbitarum]